MSEIIPAESVEAVLPEVIPAEAIEDVASADVIPADVVEQALPEGEYLSKLTRNQIVREALQARLAGEQDMTKYRAAYRQRAAEGKLLDDNRLEPDKSEGTLSSAWSVLSETARSMYEGTKELAVQAGRATGIDWERSSLTGAMYTLPEGEAEKGFENVAQASKMQLLRSAHLLNTFASRVANRLLDAGTDHSDTSFLSDPSDIRVIAFDRQFDLDLGVAMAEEGFKQGVQVSGKQFPTDPEKVEQVAASPLVDPTMMVPAAVGFMGARGSVTTAARALTAGGKAHLDEVAVQAAGKVLSKPVAAAAKVFQAAEVSANESPLMRGVLAAGVTTVAGGEPTTAALAAIAGTAVSKIRVLGAVGNSLEATAGKLAGRVPPGPLGRFAVASYRAVAPEARAAVAGQLANTPFLLGSGDEEDFKHMLAGGLVAHAAGRAAGATVNGLDIASNLWRPRNAAPETRLAVKDYGVDPALDLAHRKVVDGLGNTSSNFVQAVRDFFGKERGELYTLAPDDYVAALDRFAEQGAITKEFAADAKHQQGVTLQLKDEQGQPRAVALSLVSPRLPGLSAGHEAGHLLERLLSPEERKFVYEETRRYYGDDQVKEYQARYDELADTTGDAVKLGNQPIEATLSEIFAEHVSAVMNSVPIAQFGEGRGASQYARTVYSMVARGLEKVGVKQPRLTEAGSGPTTGTGIEPSARLGHLVENVLLAHRLDRRRVGNVFGTVDEPAAPAKEASGPLENVRPAPKKEIEPGFRKGDPIGDIRDGDGMLVGEDAKVVRPLENGRYEVEYTDPDTGVRMRGEVDGSTLESPVKPDAGAPKPVPGLITHPHPITPDTPFGAPRAEDVVAPKQLDNPEAPLPVPDQTQNTVRPEGVRDSRTANVRTTPEAQAQYAKKASPEVLKQNLDTVKRVAAAPRSEIPAVETDYYSARSDVFAPDAKVRAEQRRLADKAEQDGGPNPLRAIYQKVFVPYRFVDGPTPRVFGFSLDKLIQNVDVLRGWMREKGLDTRYLESGQLRADIQTYLDNHAHGYGGGGQRLQRPANTRPGSITPEDPSYTPRPLSQEAMQTINLLMGLPQPTSRTPGQAYLETFARLNGLDPLARSNGTAEVNPLRARLASQGFDPRLLNSAVENLPVANFTTPLKVRSDLHFPAGDTAFTQGGFMPVEKTYSWLKPNGDVEPVKTIHADDAARLLNVGPRDGMREAFRQGWARVTQFADQLMVETPNPISDKQRQALIDLAIETGKRDIVLDNHGTSPRLVWSVEDQLPAGAFMPRTQPDQLGFFSQLERTLAAVPEKATRQQIEAALRDGVKAKGQLVERPVRQEELADVKDATGLSFAEWMKQNPDATREDMLDFVRENRVQVQEKQFRSSEFGEGVEQSYTAEDWQRMSEQWERVAQSWQRNGDQAMADRYFAKAERAARYAEGLNDEGVAVGTKYEQYQLPGGENYREAVLTLPGKKVATRFNIYDREGKLLWDQPATEEAARRGAEAIGGRYEPVEWEASTAEGYVSPHFRDTPGYLAHARYNERTTAAGEKVLFAEEIQSDLHQEGRKKGYKPANEAQLREEKAALIKEKYRAEEVRDSLRKLIEGDTTPDKSLPLTVRARANLVRVQEENARLNARLDEIDRSLAASAPDAPFKKSWPELVFKHLLRKAAEKGADFLAWTTGEQQAARYDLSKRLSRIKTLAGPLERGGLNEGEIAIAGWDHAENKVVDTITTPEKLPDVVGKELAEKILSNGKKQQEFSGLDLKVGGEGMRGFYDEMLPRAVDKMLKRWGVKTETLPLLDSGWQVQEVIGGTHVGKWLARHKEYGAAKQSPWFNSEAEAKAWVASQTSLDVHAVRLTPEMRADILENGQPMFMPQGEPTKQESLVSRALSSRVTELPSPTGWVLPDGTYEGMQDRSGKFTNSGDFHLTALEQNKQRNAEKFGFELPTDAEDARLAALQRGFVRVRYDGRTGRMGVEANERFFRGAQRAAVEDVVEANLDRLDRLDINLFDDAGKVTSSRGASLFTLDGLEKSQAALDLVSGRQRAAASFMPAVRDLEDFKAPTLAKALKRPGWTILTATQEKLGDHTAPANVEANAKLRQELTERGFPFTEVAGKYLGVDQGTNFLVTGISERSAVALGKKYKQESVLTHRGLVYQDGSISPVNSRNTLVGPEAAKQDFHSILPDGTPFMLGLDFDTRIQPDPRSLPTFREVAKHLTPAEREGVRSDTAKNLVDLFDELPSDKDFITAVELGKAKRGWYERAAKTLREIFGPDTETFVSLLAATSPRQSVVDNLAMALDVWKAWTEVGRPQDPVAIRELVASRVEMEARTPNVIRALTGKDLEDAPIASPKKLNPGTELSGFKVESFRRNLLGDLLHSTNDAWMANFSGIDQRLFGTKAGYLAFTAKIRRVAKKTGLQPAEVQETIWSFFKTLYEATSVKKPAKEALAELTERDVMSAPEFHELLTEHPEILAQLERIGVPKSKIADLVDPALAGKRAAAGDQPLASALVQEGRSDKRVLARLAARAQRMKNAELAGVKVADEPETDPF
jgi:hypothetical protein